MAHSCRSLIYLMVLALAWLPSVAAPVKSEKPPGTKVSAVWLTGQAGPREIYISAADASPVALVVGGSSRGKSVVLQIGGVKTLRLWVRQPATAPGATETFASVGELALPPSATEHMLLLLAAHGGAVRGLAIADDVKSFPPATVKVANFTPGAILMRLDKQVKNLAPGLSEPFAYTVVGDPKQKVIPAFPFALAQGEQVFFNGRIDAWPGSRKLILIIPSAVAGKAPSVQSLMDAPPVAPPAKG